MLYFTALVYLAVLYIRPTEVVPALEGVPVVDGLTVIATLVAIITLFVRPRPLTVSRLDGCVLLFWFAIIVSNAAWGWLGGAYRGLLEFAPVVFFYFLVRLAVHTPEQLRGFVRVFIALNLFLAINGIVQYHTGVGLGSVTTVGMENRIRGTGIFHDPNDLGMTLVMAVPLLLWVVFDRGRRLWQRGAAILLASPILLAIAYTSSRGTFLGMCAVVMVFSFRQFKMMPALTFGAAALVVLVVLGPARAQAMDSQESSAQSRIEAWGQGLMMLKSKPAFGVGYSRFTEYHHKVAHNSFVQTAAELGLFGVTIFVAMFDTLFRTLSRVRRTASLTPALPPTWLNAMTASAAGMIVCGFFLSRQYVAVPYIMLALAGSLDTIVPGATRTMLPPVIAPAARAVVLTIATFGVVYAMVISMGAW